VHILEKIVSVTYDNSNGRILFTSGCVTQFVRAKIIKWKREK